MKKVLIVSLVLSIFTLAFSILMSVSAPLNSNKGEGDATPLPTPSVKPSASPSPTVQYAFQDDDISVRVLIDGNVTEMTMRQYLIGVVAAEMPAAFESEALKAQAVAARTETLYHILLFKSTVHPEADVCTDSTDCQAYKNDTELREKWGNDYDTYINKITTAVQDTDGVVLTYGNVPIQAVFHSSSAGKTADSSEVWTNSLPYLVSVTSPESATDVPNFVSSVKISHADFKETILNKYPQAAFPNDTQKWVTDITYTDSGRISTLRLGGVSVSGTTLRSIFGLRSTAVSIHMGESDVVFTTTGYGHGVGMSQYGANALALEGKNYREILSWYYTGVTFSVEKDLMKQ